VFRLRGQLQKLYSRDILSVRSIRTTIFSTQIYTLRFVEHTKPVKSFNQPSAGYASLLWGAKLVYRVSGCGGDKRGVRTCLFPWMTAYDMYILNMAVLLFDDIQFSRFVRYNFWRLKCYHHTSEAWVRFGALVLSRYTLIGSSKRWGKRLGFS
jgi:hypothetical protein